VGRSIMENESREICLVKRDENTKFFYTYVKYMKNVNTIWEMKREDGA
jgi:hypothetical protein